MDWTRTKLAQGCAVGRRAVPHVPGEAVVRIEIIKFSHQTVAIDLGNNRSSSNGIDIAIAFDERGLGTGQVTQRAAVDQHMLRRHRKLFHSKAHRLEPSLVDIDPVDFFDPDYTDSHTKSNLVDLAL